MIKFVLKTFFLLIAAAFTLAVLYVFELPPFSPSASQPTSEDPVDTLAAEQAALPAELSEPKIGRDKTYQEMIDRAAELEKNGFPSLAIAQYQEAYKKDPSNTTPLYEIGKINLRIARYPQAEAVFDELAAREPSSLEARIYLGRAYLGQRKISEARQLFDAIGVPSQATSYYRGIIAAFYGEHDLAKQLLNQTVSQGGNDDLTKKANNFLAAYNEYNFNTESPTVHLKVLLARSYIQCGEYEMAIPLLFEVGKEKVDYRDAWILLGYAYLQTGKYPDAIEALERAKALDPQKAETLFYLGLAKYSVNDFKAAEDNLLKAREYGFEPKILVEQKLAEVYLELQNYQKSAASYEKVLALNSEDVNYYIRPIYIYIEKLRQPEKALALAQKASERHPNQAMAHNLMGWALIYNNDLSGAENHLKLALALDSALDATYLNFGILYETQKQPEKAMLFYKKAHTIGQGNGVAASAATRYNHLLASLNTASLQHLQANISSP